MAVHAGTLFGVTVVHAGIDGPRAPFTALPFCSTAGTVGTVGTLLQRFMITAAPCRNPKRPAVSSTVALYRNPKPSCSAPHTSSRRQVQSQLREGLAKAAEGGPGERARPKAADPPHRQLPLPVPLPVSSLLSSCFHRCHQLPFLVLSPPSSAAFPCVFTAVISCLSSCCHRRHQLPFLVLSPLSSAAFPCAFTAAPCAFTLPGERARLTHHQLPFLVLSPCTFTSIVGFSSCFYLALSPPFPVSSPPLIVPSTAFPRVSTAFQHPPDNGDAF